MWWPDVNKCFAKVLSSRTFALAAGKRHIWVSAYWKTLFPPLLTNPSLRGIAVGTLETPDDAADVCRTASAAEHCQFVVPYASDVAEHLKSTRLPSFAEWNLRSNLVSYIFGKYVYKINGCEHATDATPLRRKALDLKMNLIRAGLQPNIAMGRMRINEYANTLADSKFCLVIRGDTPSTHALSDALAATCVPIIVSDRFLTVAAPFQEKVDYGTFTVAISEKQWTEDVSAVVQRIVSIDQNVRVKRNLFDRMLESRSMLLWEVKNSQAANLTLASAQRRCFHTAQIRSARNETRNEPQERME